MDGSSNSKWFGIRVLLVFLEGLITKLVVQLGFKTSNNEAENKALVSRLKLADAVGVVELTILCNSLLVVNQINGELEVRDSRMKFYHHKAMTLLHKF